MVKLNVFELNAQGRAVALAPLGRKRRSNLTAGLPQTAVVLGGGQTVVIQRVTKMRLAAPAGIRVC